MGMIEIIGGGAVGGIASVVSNHSSCCRNSGGPDEWWILPAIWVVAFMAVWAGVKILNWLIR